MNNFDSIRKAHEEMKRAHEKFDKDFGNVEWGESDFDKEWEAHSAKIEAAKREIDKRMEEHEMMSDNGGSGLQNDWAQREHHRVVNDNNFLEFMNNLNF